jgi:O-acetyl-ADP-ribose deacetylase (regulator of RNase III)
MQQPSNWIPQGLLRFATGDASKPIAGGFMYIVQVCNDEGKYGAGFSGALAKRWPAVESNYRQWWRNKFGKLELGDIQVIQVQSDTCVINMIGQHGVGEDEKGAAPIRYDALEQALSKAGIEVSNNKGSIHMPRIGCGLAGGEWEKVEPLITEQLLKRGINVTVYDLEQ